MNVERGRQAWWIHTGERERVDVLAVIAASHELLAEADSVLALGYVVKLLELLLGDTLLGCEDA